MRPAACLKMSPRSRRNRRGIALVIVLACLVLMVVMVLAFLGSIGTELRSSKFYANGSSVKLLAQSATDLVMAEIRDATQGVDSSGNPVAWASQPGMIRTFDNTGINSGTHTQYYKLYSDATMTGTGQFDATASANAVPAYWYNQKGVYVDLNLPVSINGVKQYPIIDGLSSDVTTMTGTIAGFSLSLPANTKDITSGNAVPMPVKWLYVLKQGQVIAPTSTAGSPTVTTAVTFPATDASGNSVPTPTAANPIVGRMAFWTDDETCKININTASEASAIWDVPKMQTAYDQTQLATYQPVRNEYQRYPGHPATVCLSTVFGGWLPTSSWTYSPSGTNTSSNYQTLLGPYYQLAPRIVAGVNETISSGLSTTVTGSGSQGATADVASPSGTVNAIITPDTDRLYDSIEELMFAPNTTVSGSVTSRTTNSVKYGLPTLTQTQIEQAKFFITAHSRAPDVNLFNQPRVSMWPVSSTNDTTHRSANDQVIAFCTQVGKDSSNNPYAYYFQRYDPNDPSNDLPTAASTTGVGRNRSVLEYLRFFLKQQVPGFGGSFGDSATGKYNGLDALSGDGITTTNGATTLECDQILTEIFDYIRSTNIYDQSQSGITTYTTSTGFSGSNGQPRGQVVPIVDSNGTRGFGRFPTLQQVALIFYASNDNHPTLPASATAPASPTYSQAVPTTYAPQVSQMKCFLAFQLFDPSLGYPFGLPWYKITVSGQSAFTWDGAQQMFPNDPTTLGFSYGGATTPVLEPPWGGTIGVRRVMLNNGVKTGTGSDLFSTAYPASNPSNLPLAPSPTDTAASTPPGPGLGITGINFKGGPLTISFWKVSPTGSITSTLLQKIVVNVPDAPSGGFPLATPSPVVPNLMSNMPSGYEHTPVIWDSGAGTWVRSTNPWTTWSNRYRCMQSGTVNFGYSCFVSDNDTIRAVVPTPGDLRLVAARQSLPNTSAGANYFAAHPAWNNAVHMAHDLRTSLGHPMYQASMTSSLGGGRLVPLSYCNYTSTAPGTWNTCEEYGSQNMALPLWPDVPTSAGVFTGGSGSVPGDWDNGVGDCIDGPYINKADEGDNSASQPYFYPYGSTPIGETFFSPNRQMPSAGMLGSLSTGVLTNKPWQTLLFRPGPASHPGLGSPVNTPVGPPYTTPPDSLILDYFTMPVVEPYAISEPLSTAGRINMNYQIIPFTYITRSTGIQAVLKGVSMLSVPDTQTTINAATNPPAIYKYGNVPWYASNPNKDSSGNNLTYRVGVNITSTLLQFAARFANKDVFRSPAEICSIDLVPSDYAGSTANPGSPTWRTNLDNYWKAHRITGDNSRERPYANIYPLLTTKSNTFTVHYRVQTLQKIQTSTTDQTKWLEGTDLVTGEYRGSQTIERYVDPNDSRIPDYAGTPSLTPAVPLSSLYKFRIVSTKQFTP